MSSRRSRALGVLTAADVPRDVKAVLIESVSEEWVMELTELKETIPPRAWLAWLEAASQHGANYPFAVRQQLLTSYPMASAHPPPLVPAQQQQQSASPVAQGRPSGLR